MHIHVLSLVINNSPYDQSSRKYGTGQGSNSRPQDLQSDKLPIALRGQFVAWGVKITTTILTCAYDLGVKDLKFVFTGNVIFIAMIVFGEKMATNVSDNCYDLGVKGQGHIYLIPACGSYRELMSHCLIEVVHIWQSVYICSCLYRV